ncbi:MAG: phosphatidylinositol-specific phospholipase C1-like protein [Candidatus Binatia bacterium]|nr:phosphatidylinositol-specific phospholipase C1-like protein [Candidatus Binatia bacterium]
MVQMSRCGARLLVLSVLLPVLFTLGGCGDDGETAQRWPYLRDHELRLNHFQVIGTHNSYHIEPRPALMEYLLRRLGSLAEGFQYSHIPLWQQFEQQGVRQIELDVFADPRGGLFSHRAGLALIREDPDAGIPQLLEPGFKVLHVQDIDFESTCWTLVECLQEVKRWSDEHPRHMPLMVLIEAKDEWIPVAGSAVPVPIGEAELDALDAEIRSVFPEEQLITPDFVRGDRPTLEDAVRNVGWPTLGESRGKVMFCLDNGGAVRAAYLAAHPSLLGRVMFVSAGPSEAEAGFIKLNDPIGDFDTIRDMVARGFVVRTRADADTVEARTGNTEPRDRALASGAQWVSTDYPVPDTRWGHGYVASIPGGTPARCNPVVAPADCEPTQIEHPLFLQ